MSWVDDVKRIYAIGKIEKEKRESKETRKKTKCREIGMQFLHKAIKYRIERMMPELKEKIEEAARNGLSFIEFSSRYYDFSIKTLEPSRKFPRLKKEALWVKLLHKSDLDSCEWTDSERIRMFAEILAEEFNQEGLSSGAQQHHEKDIDDREYWPWVVRVQWR